MLQLSSFFKGGEFGLRQQKHANGLLPHRHMHEDVDAASASCCTYVCEGSRSVHRESIVTEFTSFATVWF